MWRVGLSDPRVARLGLRLSEYRVASVYRSVEIAMLLCVLGEVVLDCGSILLWSYPENIFIYDGK